MNRSSAESQIWLETRTGRKSKVEARGEPALFKAQRWLEQGKVLAILGTGTVYLACAADNPSAIAELRQKVSQPEQPLPVLFPNSLAVEAYCLVEEAAVRILESAARPVVVLEQRQDSPLGKQASPFLKTIGVRLPSNHLESLLFQETKKYRFTLGVPPNPPKAIIVASSTLIDGLAGLSQGEILNKLAGLVAGTLLHGEAWEAQEAWETQMDDSVVQILHPNPARTKLPVPALGEEQVVYPLCLGRGYAPLRLRLPVDLLPVLAGGSDRDHTLCITSGQEAWIGPQNGNLRQGALIANLEAKLAHFEKLTGTHPKILVHDLDKNQLSSRFIQEIAEREALPVVVVQHHQAHLAACLADNQRAGEAPVIGIIFDFGGLGQDSQKGKPVIWGGEILIGSLHGFQRAYHLAYQPLPGGDAAAATIAHAALAYLWEAGLDWEIDIPSVAAVCAQETSLLRSMLKHRLNTPLHSSMGVLFNAVASLAGLRQETSYPAQALWELEAAANPQEREAYAFDILETAEGPGQINPLPVIRALVEDARAGLKPGRIAARFHNSVAEMIFQICAELRLRHNLTEVALSGEVWQNLLLLQKTARLLQQGGFKVFVHRQTPPNSACLSLGQALIAGQRVAGQPGS